MKDEFVSTEHLLLSLTKIDSKAKSILKLNAIDDKEILQALQKVRGSARVTSPDPEGSYQALEKYGRDLTEAASAGQLDPVIGDAALREVVRADLLRAAPGADLCAARCRLLCGLPFALGLVDAGA